jgi:uncharacterized membrane protein
VLLFFSNIGLAFALMIGTRGERDPGILDHSYRVLHRSDVWLTPLSVVVILLSGYLAASTIGLRMLQPWITRPLLALGTSGLVFGTVVLPAQRALVQRGAALVSAGGQEEHARLRRRWFLGAALATAAALAAVALMAVARPS